MKNFAPLLVHKWIESMLNTTDIVGKWAEDETEYIIKAPPQLVDSVVAMQNYVYDLNKELKDREKEIVRLTKELTEFKIARGV